MGPKVISPSLERIAVLLAASGLSDKLIYSALRDIEVNGVIDIMDRIVGLRHNLNSSNRLDFPLEQSSRSRHATSQRMMVADQISSLFRDEKINLNEAAVELLGMIFPPDSEKFERYRYRSKEGFRSWLLKLQNEIPPSELMHHATRVRNLIGRGERGDWPLRDR